ncbi:hypothetical protein CEK00_09705 [Stenotrophomonas maltophilia]|uniref:Uncharacterized protein n=1 Tax=Stenotrophomonas maltophilia TaxID=40324 RepID=A0A270NI41_STEMA|nr:hypothetical protein CEK00_21970 [Stenotrophomonas maltophilia]PAM71845.1 hypothetical protein CEK00_09650 [Stenotrophomonas maltophilia]PAM71854.1 hypothetical protein CEK00_09705 [Stenotrophomonas maltophilia]
MDGFAFVYWTAGMADQQRREEAVPMTMQIPRFFVLRLCVRGSLGDLNPSALSGMLELGFTQ